MKRHVDLVIRFANDRKEGAREAVLKAIEKAGGSVSINCNPETRAIHAAVPLETAPDVFKAVVMAGGAWFKEVYGEVA